MARFHGTVSWNWLPIQSFPVCNLQFFFREMLIDVIPSLGISFNTYCSHRDDLVAEPAPVLNPTLPTNALRLAQFDPHANF
jgi:hypothetical protein